jgi:hypothetical protein
MMTNAIQINSVEPITWEFITPAEGEFTCFCCHAADATHFIHMEINNEYTHNLKLMICKKCAEYAKANPDWLKTILFLRKEVNTKHED